jgi:hypothetical protein
MRMTRFPARARLRRVITVAVLLFAYAGCSSESEQHKETERMLIAAGFHAEPADTPEKQAPLGTLPPHTLVAEPLRVGGRETRAYVYADPDVCHCVLVGDEKAYQNFEQLVVSNPPASFRPIP